MTDYLYTYPLTDTARLCVEYEESPDNPRADNATLGSFEAVGRSDYEVHKPFGESGELPGFYEACERFGLTRDYYFTQRAADLMTRWARIFHGAVVAEWDTKYNGLWFVTRKGLEVGFGEHTDALVSGAYKVNGEPYTPAMVLAEERELYRAWAEGEVYRIVLERRNNWVRLANDADPDDYEDEPETRFDWDAVESIGGYYADADTDEEGAKAIAVDCFTLSPAEVAACTGEPTGNTVADNATRYSMGHLFPGTTPADLANVLDVRGDAK